MRPIELTLRDFRSFKGKHRITFAGRRLVAIAGPIGSGKTSILDAVAYALFGQTPKLGRHAASLINQESDDMTVRLRFTVGSGSWEVERWAKRRGTGSAKLYPYSAANGRNELEIVELVREVNSRIEEILGMDFAAFARSILLPQGEFARFLQSTAVEKDRVLKGVFELERIDRMRRLGHTRASIASEEVQQISTKLRESESAYAELEVIERELERAAERAAAVGDLQALASDLSASEQAIAVELEANESATRLLTKTVGKFRPTEEVAALVNAANTAAENNRAAAAQVRITRTKLESTKSDLLRFLADHGGEAGVENARGAVAELINRRAKAADALALLQRTEIALVESRRADRKLTQDLSKATSDASAQDRIVRRVRTELDFAQARVTELERANMAMTLREHLSEDEACPVCGQPIRELPEGHVHRDLEAARQQVKDADAQLGRSADALTAAREMAAALTAEQRAAAAQAAEAEHELDLAREGVKTSAIRLERANEVATNCLASNEPELALVKLERRLTELRRLSNEAGSEFAEAVSIEDRVRAAGQTAQEQAQALELELNVIAGEMAVQPGSYDSSERNVANLAKKLRTVAQSRHHGLLSELERIKKRASSLSDQRRQMLAEWDLPESADVNEFAARIHAEAATLRARKREFGEKAAMVPQLRSKKRDVERRLRHLERLVDDLRDSKFLKYMLAGKRAQLAELGGQRIRELTSGRFGFSSGDQFEIIDFSATEPEIRVRSSHTLSGGETFLASLSLALALADLVAGQGGRLGSFFLDEGFGSLDADHLAVAMDGIERLASETEDRLVVLVSHVPGVQERVEDQIILGAPDGPGGGSRILAGAVPA